MNVLAFQMSIHQKLCREVITKLFRWYLTVELVEEVSVLSHMKNTVKLQVAEDF